MRRFFVLAMLMLSLSLVEMQYAGSAYHNDEELESSGTKLKGTNTKIDTVADTKLQGMFSKFFNKKNQPNYKTAENYGNKKQSYNSGYKQKNQYKEKHSDNYQGDGNNYNGDTYQGIDNNQYKNKQNYKDGNDNYKNEGQNYEEKDNYEADDHDEKVAYYNPSKSDYNVQKVYRKKYQPAYIHSKYARPSYKNYRPTYIKDNVEPNYQSAGSYPSNRRQGYNNKYGGDNNQKGRRFNMFNRRGNHGNQGNQQYGNQQYGNQQYGQNNNQNH